MTTITCSVCQQLYPEDKIPFRCECGGVFDYQEFPHYKHEDISEAHGLVKYSQLLGLEATKDLITLGEGNTPLLTAQLAGNEVFLKMESMNPTGSYKDRGTMPLVNFLRSRGVTFAIEDSSGNAGASFAGYCARAGIKARVYIPESASGPKRTQIEMYGAELYCVPGPRAEASIAALKAAQSGTVYGSHAWMPFGLTGIATIAYEIVDQLGCIPGTIVAPVGHGGLLYGIMRGFESMVEAGYTDDEPFYCGVQAAGCAPIVEAFNRNSTIIREINTSDTNAEGVKVTTPVRAAAILRRMFLKKDCMLSIKESDLIKAWRQSARQGIYLEPTSALVWAAINGLAKDFKAPIVAVITGSGYKSTIHQKME